MVVDLSRISLGHSIRNGALTIVEQIPGKVMHSDQSEALRRGKQQRPTCLLFYVDFLKVILHVDNSYLQCATFARVLAILQYTISH